MIKTREERQAIGARKYGAIKNDTQYIIKQVNEKVKMDKEFADFFKNPEQETQLNGYAVFDKNTGKRVSRVVKTQQEAEMILKSIYL